MEVSDVYRRLRELIYILPILVLAFWRELGLTLRDAFYIIIGCAIAIALHKAVGVLERGITIRIQSSSASNPGSEGDEEVRTSGAGAFAGMVAGGTIGLLFGPVGVIVGGVLGALIGDKLEYESLRAEKKRKRAGK